MVISIYIMWIFKIIKIKCFQTPLLNTPLSVHYLRFFWTLCFYSVCKVCFVCTLNFVLCIYFVQFTICIFSVFCILSRLNSYLVVCTLYTLRVLCILYTLQTELLFSCLYSVYSACTLYSVYSADWTPI